MTESQRSPLAGLVLFLVCLSAAGGILAGLHYAFIDLPAKNTLTAPQNDCDCLCECAAVFQACYDRCGGGGYGGPCWQSCDQEFNGCVKSVCPSGSK